MLDVSILCGMCSAVILILTVLYAAAYWPTNVNHWELRREQDYKKNAKKDN